MSSRLAFLPRPHEVVRGPEDVGSEQRWLVELEDGTRAIVGQLQSELARDESIRRRYLRDVRRVQALPVYSLAPTLDLPGGAEVKVEAWDDGSGPLTVGGGLQRISGSDDTGVWQTPGFDQADRQILITVRRAGSGPITIR